MVPVYKVLKIHRNCASSFTFEIHSSALGCCLSGYRWLLLWFLIYLSYLCGNSKIILHAMISFLTLNQERILAERSKNNKVSTFGAQSKWKINSIWIIKEHFEFKEFLSISNQARGTNKKSNVKNPIHTFNTSEIGKSCRTKRARPSKCHSDAYEFCRKTPIASLIRMRYCNLLGINIWKRKMHAANEKRQKYGIFGII